MIPRISVVVPVYNEELNLSELIRRSVDTCESLDDGWELILVDDGSTDGSRSIITEAAAAYPGRVIGLILDGNHGQFTALLAGFAQSRGELMVTLDADLQNPPEEIVNLVAATEDGVDVVGSVRIGRQDSRFRRLASFMVNILIRVFTGESMRDHGSALRVYRRSVAEAVLAVRGRRAYIPVLANRFAKSTRGDFRRPRAARQRAEQVLAVRAHPASARRAADSAHANLAERGRPRRGFAVSDLETDRA